MEVNNEIINHALVLWNYHNFKSELSKSDFILVMGSADTRVAIHGAYLMNLGYADIIVASGGYGKVTKDIFNMTEGERFGEIINFCGVSKAKILVEKEASNSGDNLQFVKKIFEQESRVYKKGILVTKPYMKKRAFAIAMKQWPEISWQVSAPALSLDMYISKEISMDMTINLMVGDLQRIKIYPDKGFQIPMEIPLEVWDSYEFLKGRGYTKYVIDE